MVWPHGSVVGRKEAEQSLSTARTQEPWTLESRIEEEAPPPHPWGSRVWTGLRTRPHQQSTLNPWPLGACRWGIRTGQTTPKPPMSHQPIGHPFSLSPALPAPGCFRCGDSQWTCIALPSCGPPARPWAALPVPFSVPVELGGGGLAPDFPVQSWLGLLQGQAGDLGRVKTLLEAEARSWMFSLGCGEDGTLSGLVTTKTRSRTDRRVESTLFEPLPLTGPNPSLCFECHSLASWFPCLSQMALGFLFFAVKKRPDRHFSK